MPDVWPNEISKANSDPWLVENHDRIRLLRPRVLVLNFVNGLAPGAAWQKVKGLIAALRESSRFHGYADANSTPALDYQIAKLLDVTDTSPYPTTPDGNSTRYPRVPNWKEGINFEYARLFTPEFGRLYGYPDRAKVGEFLDLRGLVANGKIHEVWFLALQRNAGAPFESVEVKQAYDATFRKRAGVSVQAGNGGDPKQPFIGRSLRILFINAERGPGCAMESLGHSFEGMAHSDAIPYLKPLFDEFASFDLDRRFGLPFDSFYGRRGATMDYPDPRTLVVKRENAEPITVRNYQVVGGNVHFNPTARQDYDLDNPQSVMSTIEDYRQGHGPGGKDVAKEWNVRSFQAYKELAGDCMGPWLVYWRQNWPNYRSPARDDKGKPLKSWWPFLFY